MQAMNSRIGGQYEVSWAVGWQPTASIGNNWGYEQQGRGERDVLGL